MGQIKLITFTSQFPPNEFAKEYLPELYQEYVIVTPSVDVMSEKRGVDVMFPPTKPVSTSPDTFQQLIPLIFVVLFDN